MPRWMVYSRRSWASRRQNAHRLASPSADELPPLGVPELESLLDEENPFFPGSLLPEIAPVVEIPVLTIPTTALAPVAEDALVEGTLPATEVTAPASKLLRSLNLHYCFLARLLGDLVLATL